LCLSECVCAYVCANADVRACVRPCVCACLRACVRACVRACMRACVPACVRACVGACVRACLYVCWVGVAFFACPLVSLVSACLCCILHMVVREECACMCAGVRVPTSVTGLFHVGRGAGTSSCSFAQLGFVRQCVKCIFVHRSPPCVFSLWGNVLLTLNFVLLLIFNFGGLGEQSRCAW
jgi:hypothetical protein